MVVPVFRSPHSAEHTARGVANGVFWGLTPTIGLQTMEIVATWFIARQIFRKDSSLLQALVWVWINNPLTALPMYYAFYLTGLWLLGNAGTATGYDQFGELVGGSDGWFARVAEVAEAVGVPLLLGCVPYATLGAVLSHRWATTVVRRRRKRLARKRADYETFRTLDPSG